MERSAGLLSSRRFMLLFALATAALYLFGLTVPLLGPDACLGVLALEFRHGREARVGSRAVATILGAALTQLIERFRPVEAQEAETDAPPTIETPPERVLRTGTRH